MASLTQTIESNREGLFARLSAMCRDGQIITDRIGRYVLVDRAGLVSGRVIAHRMGLDFLNRMTMGIGSIYMIGRCERYFM